MEVAKGVLQFIVLIGAAFAVVWKVFKSANTVVKSVNDLKADNEKQREQTQVITHGVLASLDGLQQLGANGNVTKAHKAIEDYMIQQLR